MKPTRRPANPCFSSGPCAKRPGWSPAALSGALVGRSHRSAIGLAQCVEIIERSRALLQIPGRLQSRHRPGLGYRRGRDGDVVAAGRARRRCPVLGEFRRGLGRRCRPSSLKLPDVRHLQAPYGRLPDLSAGRSRPRRGVRVERHDLGRARAERRLDRRRPQGADDLRRDLGGVRDAAAVAEARCRDLVVAEGAGRRGGARHARARARARSSGSRATRRPGRCRRSSA